MAEAKNIVEIGHSEEYYAQRKIVLDTRGTINISPRSHMSYCITIWTLSHNPNNFSETVDRPVIVEDDAWISSNCVLYNCHIGKGAVVSCGTIVRSRDIPAWTMVEGNPPQIIARFNHDTDKWDYLSTPESIPQKRSGKDESS